MFINVFIVFIYNNAKTKEFNLKKKKKKLNGLERVF